MSAIGKNPKVNWLNLEPLSADPANPQDGDMFYSDGTPRLDPETKKRLTPAEYFAQLRDDSVAGVHFRPRYGTGGGSRSGWDGEVDHTTDLQKIPHATLGAMAFTKAGGRR
jgi:hypothetical protein